MSTGAEQLATFSSSSATPGGQSIPNLTAKTLNSSYHPSAQSPSSPSQAGPSTWQSTGSSPIVQKNPRTKARTQEENDIIQATAARFASRLAEDHAAVLNPDVDSPFVDSEDVVKRLLPYHIFLNPEEDITPLVIDRKGKSKADELRRENAETKFALECFKRRRDLEKRFRNTRIKSGENPYKEEIVAMTNIGIDSDRADQALLQSELRAARAEQERLERAKRAASSTPRPSYYNTPPPPSTPAGPTAYYRTYAYAQPYTTGAVLPPTVSTFSVNPTTTATTTTTAPTPSVPAATPMSAAAAPTNPAPSAHYQAGVAIPVPNTSTPASGVSVPSTTPPAAPIPVQLPVACLPALYRIGITPVPPTATQPPPPAVLRGSNGSMLNLEINVSLLQPGQMSGLALILSSVMTRSSTAATQAPAAATTHAPNPPTNVKTNGTSG
ncbi:hypothetical protein V5O48_008755 [Marasmius crinis-equi]|uniref:GLTSCR protein conserved domain-containing protein n=1 Tax=Marasmius crinis-equi TaxID=585013 RepID=A0ABR3FD10_9AGAR